MSDKMSDKRPGFEQKSWWLPKDLINEIKIWQHEQRIDTLTRAVIKLLKEGLQKYKER